MGTGDDGRGSAIHVPVGRRVELIWQSWQVHDAFLSVLSLPSRDGGWRASRDRGLAGAGRSVLAVEVVVLVVVFVRVGVRIELSVGLVVDPA
jgi:hypothetical protein